jgi:GNAT superfamily N-acetyltransferase
MIQCSFLEKGAFGRYSGRLFDILADNMSVIAPTGNAREDDYRTWHEAVFSGLHKENRQIVLILDAGALVGYFQYDADGDTFFMEEIQLAKSHQGKRIFRRLYGYVLPKLHGNVRFVKAYASKRNQKSNGILARLGLAVAGENLSGTSWLYRGNYEDLLRWFNHGTEDGAQ